MKRSLESEAFQETQRDIRVDFWQHHVAREQPSRVAKFLRALKD